MAKKFSFYELRHLIKSYPSAKYYMVIGERSNGKTYSALSYALERYVKSGEQFAYIRRFSEDIKRKHMMTLFSSLIENGEVSRLTKDEWTGVDYSVSKFYLDATDGNGDHVHSDEPIGFAFDLNGMEHYKSTSFPRVSTIIFDEFMSRSGYLPNEFILFTNTLSTIIRHRDNVKIVMLGNTVNKYCPYFEEMGLYKVKNQLPGTTDVYKYGHSKLEVVVDYAESSAKSGGKASDVYFAFENPELKMITSGSWEIAVYPHLDIKIRPKDIVYNFFVDFNGEMLHGEIVSQDNGAFIYFHRKTTPIKDESEDIVYTATPDHRWNYRMALTKHNDNLSRFILQCLRENRIFYSTNEVGEVFRNYVMWSDTFSIKN